MSRDRVSALIEGNYVWIPVRMVDGEIDWTALVQYQDQMGRIVPEWEWRRFRLVEDEPDARKEDEVSTA